MPAPTITTVPAQPSYYLPPDRKDRNGRTPLFNDVDRGDVDRVRAGLASGARAHVKDRLGTYLLTTALRRARGDGRIVAMLLEHGAKVTGDAGLQALDAAASEGSQDLVERLIAAGADLQAEDGHGHNALTAAASRGHTALVIWMLEHGARAENQHPATPRSALLAATQRLVTNDPQERAAAQQLVGLLLDAGADPNRAGLSLRSKPSTPVLEAIVANDLLTLDRMAGGAIGVNLVQRVGGVQVLGQVLMATAPDHPDAPAMVDRILALRPRLNDGPVHGQDVALVCALNDRLDGVEQARRFGALLDAGADPMVRYPWSGSNVVDRFLARAFNGTAATAALREPALLERLVAHPMFDANGTSTTGETSLMHLVSTTALIPLVDQAARFLLDHGANVNAVNADGWTVLTSLLGAVPQTVLLSDPAARFLDALLKESVDWNAGRRPVDEDLCPGGFLAHQAVGRAPLPLFERLVRAGMPLDQEDVHGDTPLHRALRLKRYPVGLALLDAGAPVERRNHAGQLPHEVPDAAGEVVDAVRARYEGRVLRALLRDPSRPGLADAGPRRRL